MIEATAISHARVNLCYCGENFQNVLQVALIGLGLFERSSTSRMKIEFDELGEAIPPKTIPPNREALAVVV